MTLEAGQKLSHYRLIEKIGAGGMGEVYAAEDSTLKRRVALKILPADLAASRERLERFQREAESLASLNHPNIVHVYTVEEDRGIHFLTMELVEGEGLARMIPEGGLALERFLSLALPLAEALAEAHEQGIVHRDLKPANIMVDARGRPKILDFGLAKLRQPEEGEGLSRLSTEMLTEEGRVLGTYPYMSPEQAVGGAVDARSDVFSLGVMLYEMAGGRRPFHGETPASLISSIISHRPPPLADMNREVPGHLESLIDRCLAKDPEDRFQTAEEVRLELERVQREVVSQQALREAPSVASSRWGVPAGAERRSPGRWIAAAAVAAALVATGLVVLMRQAPSAVEDSPAALTTSYQQVTSQPGAEQYPSLSPDGKWLVFSGEGEGGRDIFLQRVGGQTPINLTRSPDADDEQPVYSADGELVAFRSSREGGGLFVMGPTGEAVRRVTREGFNPAWSPDGTQLAYATESVALKPLNWEGRSVLWSADVATGETRRVSEGDAVQPRWSPNGHRIAYTVRFGDPVQMDIETIPAEGGEPVRVTSDPATDWSPAWSPDGRFLYFASDRSGSMNLWVVPVDEESGKVLGEPRPITTPATFLAHLSVGSDGRTVAYNSVLMTQNVQRIELDPVAGAVLDQPRWVTSGSILWSSPDPSPDGEWVTFYSRMRPEGDLYVSRADGTGLRQLTADEAKDRVPRWSPDGEWIVYFSDRGGRFRLWKIRPDGSGLTQVTEEKDATLVAWSPDSKRIAGTALTEETAVILRADRASAEQELEALPAPEESLGLFVVTSWSPDGARLAGQSNFPGEGVLVYSFDTSTYERLTDFGEWPVWLPDSRRLLFVAEGRDYYLVDSRTKATRKIFSVSRDVIGPPRITRDGRQIFFTRRVTEADIWLLTLE